MTGTVLGLWLDDAASPATRMEAWRTLVAARAGGMAVRLFDLRPAQGTPPAPPDLPDAEQRLVDALAAEGASFEAPDPQELCTALGRAQSIVTLPAPGRAGTPAVLAVDAALLGAPAPLLVERLRAAGQILPPMRDASDP